MALCVFVCTIFSLVLVVSMFLSQSSCFYLNLIYVMLVFFHLTRLSLGGMVWHCVSSSILYHL
jgi:hypothetical protein